MRFSLKVVGASGQGNNSIGEILSKGFKRSGYCVFAYREYPSLIKGGHASYQIDIAEEEIRSSEEKVDCLITFNHHAFEYNLPDMKDGGLIVHFVSDWEFSKEDQTDLKKRRITVINLPVEEILKRLNAKSILGNVLLTSFVWALCKQRPDMLKELVTEQFGHKKDLLEMNMKCIDEGTKEASAHQASVSFTLPNSHAGWKKHLLVTGSQAMGLGIIHAGCRFYAGYPMTPSSPLLKFLADMQNQTGMVMKQAEDEITAAQLMSGAMHMGTRAATGTSGGGFDLMTETLSMNGIIENPAVFMLGMRPGPATGLPTWTAQGDLFLAIYGGHGEFARMVIAVSDSQDCFDLMPKAFNYAEKYQTPVVVLTDKHIAEALFTQAPYDQKEAKIERGKLITNPSALKKLKATDRYDANAEEGISPRWLPGSEAVTYCAQGDEHNGDGSVDETAMNAKAQMEKRLKKLEAMEKELPEPELFGMKNDAEVDVLIVGWGSTKGAVLDILQEMGDPKIGYLHYTYMWPLKTERLKKLAAKAKKIIAVEGNAMGQLCSLIRMQTGIEIEEKILKYDGRPFFLDELRSALANFLTS